MIGFLPAAGIGSRLRSSFDFEGSKELVEVGGRHLIDYSLDILEKRGITDVVIAIAPGKESVSKYVALSRPQMNVMTVYQREPTGTGRAVGLLKPFMKDYNSQALYLMPDSVFAGLPFRLVASYATVYLWVTDCPEKMGVFRWNSEGFAYAHAEKKMPAWPGPWWAWGAAVLNKSFVDFCADYSPTAAGTEWTVDDAFDLFMVRGGSIAAFPCDGYYQDCGTWEGIAAAEAKLLP